MNNNEHFEEQKIHLYKSFDSDMLTVYDGKEYYEITKQERNEILSRPFKRGYILVPSMSKKKKKMKKEYKKYISMIDTIKSLTDNKINMYKTGTFGKTALALFNKLNDIKSDKVEKYEFNYLNNGAGVRYARTDYEGIAYKYDINSYYASIMLSKYARFPITKGTILNIKTDELEQKRFAKFGVYNVRIYCDDDVKFTTLKSNMYSHYEVNYAKILGLKIEVIGPALVWNKEDTIPFYDVFNKYVNYLYKLKSKNTDCKTILNSLWGSLVAKRGGMISCDVRYEDLDTKNNKILKITPIGNDFVKCRVIYKENILYYRTPYARINPFLLGFARIQMHKTFNKIGYDHILRSHTDSIMCDIPLKKQIKINYSIGSWKYEGKCDNCVIYNKNFFDGDFN